MGMILLGIMDFNILLLLFILSDAAWLLEAIKSRFGGSDESKKMQKSLLKQQFQGFLCLPQRKYLRSLLSSWSQVALIMRTKPRLDTLSFDDLYNNQRVFKRDVKGTTASSSNIQNVTFVSVKNTSSTNDVSTAYSVSSPSVSKSQKEGSSSNVDKVIHCFFANQSSTPQLDYDVLEQINDDVEEMDLKWQVAMISMRIKKFHKRTGRKLQFDTKDLVGNQDSKKRDVGYNGNKTGENGRNLYIYDDSKALVTMNGEDIDWSEHVEEDAQNYAMMAYFSSNLGSDNEGPDVEIDYSKFIYGPKKTSSDESDSKPSEYASCESNSSVETSTSIPEPVENASKVICEPIVWTAAPIIEEYESDSDNDSVSNVQEDKEKPSFTFTDSVKHVKTSMENIKETGTTDHSPKIEKQDRNGHTRKGLGYVFTRKACFVCGSFSHLIRDYDLHEKRMAKQAELTKSKNKVVIRDTKEFLGTKSPTTVVDQSLEKELKIYEADSSQRWLGHIIGNKAHLVDYQDFKGCSVAIGGSNGRITSKEKINTGRLKVIKGEYSKAKTPQQNEVSKRKNRALIEAARTMLADSFLPTTFWATAFNTACYVLNRVLITKPQNKTPYELLTVGYSLNSKAFRVYNLETKRVKENLHVNFLENKPNVAGKGHAWMFDLDYLTNSMNYEPVSIENKANKSANLKEANNSAGTQANDDQGANSEEIDLNEEHFVLPIWSAYSTTVKSSRDKIEKNTSFKTSESLRKEATHDIQNASTSSTNLINTASTPLSTIGLSRAFNDGELSYHDPSKYALPDDPLMPHLEDIYASPSEGIFSDSSYDDEDLPFKKNAIRTKWVYRNKKDERGVVVRKKARLVTQRHRQEEGTNYDEVFALVDRIEAIRIFLAFSSYMGFIVYQMDVKSSFLYGTINEEVYVSQPPGFVDPKFPNKVYKVVKALYGLYQAPRAWYVTLSTFLEKIIYRRGAIDKTWFMKKDKKDIMLVQVYVDDIIFGSTKKSWCDEFGELMKNRFQMSSMGKLTFFFQLQVKQKEDGIFISQDKYVAKILKKFDFLSVKTVSTLIETQKPLVKDEEAIDVDVHLYWSMIGSLMYLTASRPDIMFVVCVCSRFQVTPKTSHLHVVKRIFRYLKVQPKLGNPQQDVVNFLAGDLSHSNAKSRLLWILLLQRDAYEKKLIQLLKIHIDDNVADLLTKAFDVSMFNFLVVNIRLLNL
nr:retrovirus-related Pol polyprotein from transposon TNT 1-94 [Tanacetum cinerariifolium]